MADLTAKFSMVDEITDKLAGMSESGQAMLGQWSQAGEAANAAFDGLAGAATTTATTADGIATSINSIQEASSGAQTSAGGLSDTMNNYGTAAEEAASQTDYWTDSVGNYNKGMLEAVYSTEELVEMGYKSAAALEEEQEMFALCEQSVGYLNKALEGSEEIQNSLNEAMGQAGATLSELAGNENVSAEAKAELGRNSTVAAEAMQGLATAQAEAAAAMENYDAVLASGTTDLSELEAAAERAYHAADDLAEANGKASAATEELSKSTQEASGQADKAGDSGQNAVESIAGALAAAGITAMVKEIGDAAYELADAFSEAESTVVLATGATGEALGGLTASMMNAYAASKTGTLDETASAVGEINTRLAYTGDMLEKTTGQFLDFAAITGGDATAAVRSVTQLMNQWGVPATEMETMLSKLAYAGQASGISVESLSQQLTNNKAVLDQLGFTLDQATAMFMNFELAGTNSAAVMAGFRTALSKGEVSSLNELNEVFGQIASGAMDAAQASELFGGRAGPAIVNAVQGGALSLDEMVSALEAADSTLATTADAAQTLGQKWSQATGNISTAFTTALDPALSSISSGLAGMVNGIGDFLNAHPAVTKAISALAIGLGTVAVGIAGVGAASTALGKAVPAIVSFGTSLNTALGPIGWVALAITGIVAAGTALVAMFSEAGDETAGMTAATRQQYYELQGLNAEYDEACAKYGETSEEALRLKYQVDDLSEAFEANRQTLEEFEAEVDALVQSHDELMSSYGESLESISHNEQGTLALIQKLEDLASQTDRTAAQEEQMKAVVDQLNGDLPGLALSYEDVAKSTDACVESMKKTAAEQARQERQAEQKQAYVELLKEQAELEEKIAGAEEDLRIAQENNANAASIGNDWVYETGAYGACMEEMREYEEALDDLNATYAENQAALQEIESEWEEVAAAAEAAEDASVTGAEAAAAAYEGVREDVEQLCAAYDAAYQSAVESFGGQFGLFDEATTKSEEYLNATVENAQKAIESQLAYWESYSADVETLRSKSAADLGITQENYEALMSYAQDGSEQAAGLAHSMAEAIKSGDEKAVAELANTLGEVVSKQDEIATATAEWQTNFTNEMNQYAQEMEKTVKDMDLSEEAKASATSTIKGYVNSIKAGKKGAVSAAQDIADSVSAALKSASASVNVNVNGSGGATATAVSAYANGTTDAEDIFIAGEAGPELVVGKPGSTVFPAEETAKIMAAVLSFHGADPPQNAYAQSAYHISESPVTENIWNSYDYSQTYGSQDAYDYSQTYGSQDSYDYSQAYGSQDIYDYSQAYETINNYSQEGLAVLPNTQGVLHLAGEWGPAAKSGSVENGDGQAKRILLEIAGSGAIEVSGNGGIDKERILEVLTEHIKPVLLGILQQEIYEEGDRSYEF